MRIPIDRYGGSSGLVDFGARAGERSNIPNSCGICSYVCGKGTCTHYTEVNTLQTSTQGMWLFWVSVNKIPYYSYGIMLRFRTNVSRIIFF